MYWVVLTALMLLGPPAAAQSVQAARVIRAGEIILSEAVTLSDTSIPGAAERLEQVLGQESRGLIYSGQPIRLDQLGPPTVVSRNQPVVLVFAGAGLRIEAEGRALDRGSVGDNVRAMNLASRRTVLGEVLADGTISVRALR